MDLEDKLKFNLSALYCQLDNELQYIDRKECIPEMQLRKKIHTIEGFLLGCSYVKSVYHQSKVKYNYTPKGGNSIIDNQKEYLGD